MKVSRVKATGKIIEGQSAGTDATLTSNAVADGYDADDIEIIDMTDAEFKAALETPLTLAEAVERKFNLINQLRDRKRYPGNVATGLGWDVDLRNGTDEANIKAKYTKALRLKITGSSDTITFVGADNVARNLTADQMITAGEAADASVTSIYAHSWGLKAAVNALVTIDEVDAYDVSTGWPS